MALQRAAVVAEINNKSHSHPSNTPSAQMCSTLQAEGAVTVEKSISSLQVNQAVFATLFLRNNYSF